MQDDDTPGEVSFTIDGSDLAGNALGQVTSVTDSSRMAIDRTAPSLSDVSISSDNAISSSHAKDNDTVTLAFTSSEAIAEPSCAFYTGSQLIIACKFQGRIFHKMSMIPRKSWKFPELSDSYRWYVQVGWLGPCMDRMEEDVELNRGQGR